MTQENKELLLKDLCVRLPYKTYVKTTKGIGYVYAINTSQLIELSVANDSEYWSEVFNIDEIKPYLRPLSNITKEEKEELIKNFWGSHTTKDTFEELSWNLSKHLDINELIPKGLAIEVTEENNPYEN